MRGPRPVLKEETRVMLKVMDDMEVPDTQHPYQDQYGLSHRQPIAQNEPPPPPGPAARRREGSHAKGSCEPGEALTGAAISDDPLCSGVPLSAPRRGLLHFLSGEPGV